MEVLTSVICDSAADYNGKLCVMGAFDTIYAQRFPIVHPHFALALRIVFRSAEEGAHRIRIAFIDPDGRNVLPREGEPRFEFNVPPIPENTAFVSRNFVISLQGLPLEKPSLYSFDVYISARSPRDSARGQSSGGVNEPEEQIIARIPLQVVSANPQA